uniref:Transmembrane protein n=1 Tax=Macrostomum lignano TaxID=282301 RepID=A0A1I8J8F3_9PLAT
MMPSQVAGYHTRSEPEIVSDDSIVAIPAVASNRIANNNITNSNHSNSNAAFSSAPTTAVRPSVQLDNNTATPISNNASNANATTINARSSNRSGRDGDADSLLEVVSARTNSRVPLLLGWAQLVLGLVGCVIGLSDALYRSCANRASDRNNASSTAFSTSSMFKETEQARPFDVTAGFGFPLWCSISLHLYRLYSLLNLGLLCLGLLLLVLSWVSQSQPTSGDGDHQSNSRNWPIRLLQALNAILLITSWLLVLACVLCDFCIGKNLLQVLGIFVRTVCRKSQRDSFSELKRSNNSLNYPYTGAFGKRGTGSGNRPLLKLMMPERCGHVVTDGADIRGICDDCQSEDEEILGNTSFVIR